MDLEKLRGKLIVSCQALDDEPLHSSFIMGKMSLAAKIGGASGIRAQSVEDIKEIQKQVDPDKRLPPIPFRAYIRVAGEESTWDDLGSEPGCRCP